MSNGQNPYGSGTGGYTVQFGNEAPAPAAQPTGAIAAGATPTGLIKDTTTAGFSTDVIRESRQQPVLVDFWAPWCGPCKQLTPALEKAVQAAGGKVKLVKMNIDDHPSIAGQLGIQSIPAVIAFKNGQPVDGFMGAIALLGCAAIGAAQSYYSDFESGYTAGADVNGTNGWYLPTTAGSVTSRWMQKPPLPAKRSSTACGLGTM